jgi:pimeloyl-ACP methyl ester carboxylesterase
VQYADVGSGPAVVALHGAMGGYDQGLILAQTIASPGYRYLAVSRPGFLGTPMISGRSPAAQGDLVTALLDELGIAGAGVLAVSGGGPSALHFALRHPGRCRGLVLVATCADKVETRIPPSFRVMQFLARWPGFVGMLRRRAEGRLESVAGRSIHEPEILARTIHDAEVWPLFSTLLLSTFDRMGQRLEGTANDIAISRSTTYPLEELVVPVLIVHGTRDRMASFDVHTAMYMKRVRDAQLLVIDGGEHVAIFTHRRMVRERVTGFMRRHF